MVTHNAHDVDRDLRPLEDYAIASVIGCALLAVAFCLAGCVAWALVAWL
jgi:hypothetical protein